MRWVEHRRHSARVRPSEHLSPEGVALARLVGATTGPFARVVTSPIVRAVETAEAMGFRVDEQRPELASVGDEIEAVLHGFPANWDAYWEALQRSAAARTVGDALVALLTAVAESIPDGSRALVVSHGGVVELSAVAAVRPTFSPGWGAIAGYCEGIRLQHDGGRFVSGEVLRVARRSTA